MAGIPLRTYLREVEKLIETGRYDEAIAHSRYILQSYPKYIDAYRHLGKAYLESQRYGDAADIFQRVLSSIPDDFVSHVGMSLIREDEGNLDEAIWHMERAFEVQPANGAIQEELRRLYKRRDGVQPAKIRLTRGALSRMYFLGDNLPQAIAEIRAALAEDPSRLDLQLLLCSAHAKSNHKAEAAETANAVLRKLPHCLEAHRVMAEILSASERQEEAQGFLDRMKLLDPYTAYISSNYPTSDQVPDEAISLEKLVWKPTPGGETGQPAWAASLGVQMEEQPTSQESLPDWLTGTVSETPPSTDAQPVTPFEESSPVELPSQEISKESNLPDWLGEGKVGSAQESQQIPEWLASAGWTPSSGEGEAQEAAKSATPEEPPQEPTEGELAAADIPDWLRAMAPLEELAKMAEPEEDISSWVDNIFEAEKKEAEAVHPAESSPEPSLQEEAALETPLEAVEIPGATQPPSLDDMSAAAAPLGQEGGEETPDWLKESLAEIPEQEEKPFEPEMAGDEFPEWLKEAPASEEGTPAQQPSPDEGIPTFLIEESAEAIGTPEPEKEQAVEAFSPEIAPSEEIPERLMEEAPTTEETPSPEAPPVEEIPDWLKEEPVPLEAETPAAEAAIEQETPVEIPDWLFEEAELESAPKGQEEMPDWLVKARTREEETTKETTAPTEKPPAWVSEEPLEAVEFAGTPPADETSGEVAAEPAVDLSDWLAQTRAEHLGEITPERTATGEIPPWLLEQATKEEETSAPVEEVPSAEIPSWLLESEESPEEVAPPGPTEQGLPSWLLEETETPSPEAISGETAPPETAEKIPEWLEKIEEPPVIEGDTQPTRIHKEAPPAVEMETKKEMEVPSPELSPEETPPTLEALESTMVEEAPSIPIEVAAQVESPEQETVLTEDEAAFAWLESLAVKQGAEEALLLKPEERMETPPDWVVEETAAAQAVAEEEALPSEEPLVESVEVLPVMEETPAPPMAFEPSREGLEAPEPSPVETTPLMPTTFEPLAVEPTVVKPATLEPTTGELPPTKEEIQAVPETPTPAFSADETLPGLPTWLREPLPEEPTAAEWTPSPVEPTPLDINAASMVELERLPGVGFVLAQRIVTRREQQGQFTNLDELLSISGMDQDLLDSLRSQLVISLAPATPLEPAPIPPFQGQGEAPPELAAARQAWDSGDTQNSLELYAGLIKAGTLLDYVVHDLQKAAEKSPNDFMIWQSLGDAYFNNNQIEEALQAFARAEQLLR